MDVIEQKAALRTLIGEWNREFPESLKREQEQKIFSIFERMPQFVAAQKIAIYWSLKNEFQTKEFIKKWSAHKCFYLPKVINNQLLFCPFEGEANLIVGAVGKVLEPKGEPFKGQFDLVVVPGMAFTERGDRLGRGGGFYDRFLQSSNAFKVALCYDYQQITELPLEEHDERVDFVISYKG